MKGLIYEGFLRYRKFFLISGIIMTVLTAAAILIAYPNDNPETVNTARSVFILGEVFSISLAGEWSAKNLEENIKSRFADMAIAGGISKNAFVMAELLKNLLSTVIGLAICLAANGIAFTADNIIAGEYNLWDISFIKLTAVLAAIFGVIEFINCPLVIKFKSAEKAGITMCLSIGLIVIMPLTIFFNLHKDNVNEEVSLQDMLGCFMNKPYSIPLIIGAAAVIYAISYTIMLKRVKRGDVC